MQKDASDRQQRSWKALAVLALGVAGLTPLTVSAALNDTGQTLCWDGNVMTDCTANVTGDAATYPRQDGRYGRDARATAGKLSKVGGGSNGFDFTKIANNGVALPTSAVLGAKPNDWACTHDNVTGLTWEIKTNSGRRGKDWTYTWYSSFNNGGDPGDLGGATCGGTLPYSQCNTQAYVKAVNAAGLCGANDWRLPTANELLGLIHIEIADPDPLIDTEYFPNNPTIDPSSSQDTMFWSATRYAEYSSYAWMVDFGDGRAMNRGRSDDYAVRLVRGQQPASSFANNGDGTITDNNTGLMWARCREGQRGSICANGNPAKMSWETALTAAKMSRLAGYSDWRLPNKKELESLVDYSRSNPAINTTYFPMKTANSYNDLYSWTSTSQEDDHNWHRKWLVDFREGWGKQGTSLTYDVRLVRDGAVFDALVPPIPSPKALTATASSPTQINLTWQDRSKNETSFRIERKIGNAGNWTRIAQVKANTTKYSNTGLKPKTLYVYRVRAANAKALSTYSNTSSAKTP